MLSERHTRWLTEGRRISIEMLERFGIHSGSSAGGVVTPDPAGDVLVFPFRDGGKLVNEKYRAAEKRFWQWPNDRPGRRSTFFNADVLDVAETVVITEGELDCLVAAEAGYHAVSVPDGAPSGNPGEASPKFEFLWNNRERLKKIKRFILAVDNDDPGQRLADELCRALSAGRCLQVTYPEGSKDLNDVLKRHDLAEVDRVLKEAKHYPVKGLYQLQDYPDGMMIDAVECGWATDQFFKPFRGGLAVVTGIPAHGKSTWALNVLVRLAKRYGWRSAIFSPEMPVAPFLRSTITKIAKRLDPYGNAVAFANEHFCFIDADPNGVGEDEDFTLEWILDKATEAVLRYGIQCLLIDPWNEMDCCRRDRESMTDYIGRALRAIKRFARERKVFVMILAHPSKEVWREGKTRPPTLYDIADSAHFYNKCDLGVVIHRDVEDVAEVMVCKARFRATGSRGETKMMFEKASETFEGLLDIPASQEAV